MRNTFKRFLCAAMIVVSFCCLHGVANAHWLISTTIPREEALEENDRVVICISALNFIAEGTVSTVCHAENIVIISGRGVLPPVVNSFVRLCGARGYPIEIHRLGGANCGLQVFGLWP